MTLVYRSQMLLGGVFLPLIVIIIVLVVPVLFRLCWNSCACCRKGCHRCGFRNKHRKMHEEWVSSSSENPLSATTRSKGTEESDGKFVHIFEPGLPAQIFIFLVIGFMFNAISAFTDAPFYVIWIVLFLVWSFLFIDFLRRTYEKKVARGEIQLDSRAESSYHFYSQLQDQEDRSPSKEKFDAYEAAGIDRDNIWRKFKRYMGALGEGIRAYVFVVLAGIIAIIIISGVSTIFSSCMCVASNPTDISTYLSRRIQGVNKYCKVGQVCNVYFTLADTESDMIVNFHESESPDLAFVAYDVISHSQEGNMTVEEWIGGYQYMANATTFKMDTISEFKRWVSWADVRNLSQDTTYYFVPVYVKNGNMISSSKEYKVRTLPVNGTYNFITGGDMSVDENSQKLIKDAASRKPHFAVIGGDNAYDNGFKQCYLRWDRWFHFWDTYMTQNDGGYTIPFILAIGNHEAGRFFAEPGDDPYYTSYFPQQVNLQDVNPRFRKSFHAHRFGDSSFFILDTNVVERINGPQKDWLAAELAPASKIKIVTYHGNIYPSAHLDKQMADEGKEHWVPLFDQYNVSIAFENHLHLYKRTKPLRNNKVDPAGITYFGDGDMGAEINPVPLWHADYIEKVDRKKHFFYVTMENYSYITVSAIQEDGTVFDSWDKSF